MLPNDEFQMNATHDSLCLIANFIAYLGIGLNVFLMPRAALN